MNREEFLKSKNKGQFDEGYVEAEKEGFLLANKYVPRLALLLVIISFLRQDIAYELILAATAYGALRNYPLYKFTGYKYYLLAFVANALLGLGFLVAFLIHLGS